MAVLFFLTLKKKITHLPLEWMWVLFIYLAFSTIVHPWYSTPVVFLSILAGFRFGMVWSIVIALSYAAYQNIPYTENYWLEAVEYMVLAGALIWEFFRFREKNNDSVKRAV